MILSNLCSTKKNKDKTLNVHQERAGKIGFIFNQDKKTFNFFRTSKKSRRTSSDNVSTPSSLRSRSSSIISTADEDLIVNEVREEKFDAGKSDIDTLFELVHDLKHKDLEEHKNKIEQAQLKEQTDPEPEPSKLKEERTFSFKHLSGVGEVRVLNLGNPDDLQKVLVPTQTMKIDPVDTPPTKTTDIASLIVKTTPVRIYGYQDNSGAVSELSNKDVNENIDKEETSNTQHLGAIRKNFNRNTDPVLKQPNVEKVAPVHDKKVKV